MSDVATEGGTLEFVVMMRSTTRPPHPVHVYQSADDMKPDSIVQLTLTGSDNCDQMSENHGHADKRAVHLPLSDDIVPNLR